MKLNRKLTVFLAISFGWTCLLGALLWSFNIDLGSVLGIALVALLYMPTPFVAALITERGLKKDRLSLPSLSDKRAVAVFLLLPVVAFLGLFSIYGILAFIGGNILNLPGFGTMATTQQELLKGAADLLGQAAVEEAGAPPPIPVLLLASVWGAIVAGWTINGLFALGEEYGWRGFMWDELRSMGVLRANLLIGLAWGLWHAPLILQGYNFPNNPITGVIMMCIFTISASFALSALRERTGSVLPAAALHGMFNAFAALMLILMLEGSIFISGPLGLLGSLAFGLVGLFLWLSIRQNTS